MVGSLQGSKRKNRGINELFERYLSTLFHYPLQGEALFRVKVVKLNLYPVELKTLIPLPYNPMGSLRPFLRPRAELV